MALPLLRRSCRRPLAGLSAYLRLNKLTEVASQSVWRNQASVECVASGVRFCSSDGKGRRQSRHVPMVGGDNVIAWLQTKCSLLFIRAFLDKDFRVNEFTDGAIQAFAHVSQLLSECRFKELEGLVAQDLIGKLEEKCADLPPNYKRALSADPDDVVLMVPTNVGFCFEDDGRRFVSILMHFWYFTSARLPEETTEGVCIVPMAAGKKRQKPETKRLLRAVYEFQREFTQGVTPEWTITRIEHSKLLD